MKNILFSLLLLLVACNSKDKSEALAADNARIEKEKADSLTLAALPVETTESPVADEITNWATPVLDAAGQDSLFNILVRQQLVRGEFERVKLITDKVLDAATPDDARKLIAVLALTSQAQD